MTTLVCLGCGTSNQIQEPAEDSWSPILAGGGPFEKPQIVGWQLTFQCVACGHRTVVNQEDVK